MKKNNIKIHITTKKIVSLAIIVVIGSITQHSVGYQRVMTKSPNGTSFRHGRPSETERITQRKEYLKGSPQQAKLNIPEAPMKKCNCPNCPYLANHVKKTCYACPCCCYKNKTLIKRNILDDKMVQYWQVYNASDKPLVFYTDDLASVTIPPGEERRIFREKSFGFAIKSIDLKSLGTGSTTKHYITIFQDGRATDLTNKHWKYKKWQFKEKH